MSSVLSLHEQSPFAGMPDPILRRQMTQMVANVAEGMFARYSWSRSQRGEADPRRSIAQDCGWPESPPADLFSFLFASDSTAARVCEVWPRETWFPGPMVFEDEDEKKLTPFEKSLDRMRRGLLETGGQPSWFEGSERGDPLASLLFEADVISGVNTYGGVVCVYDDGLDTRLPVAGINETNSRPAEKNKRPGEGRVIPVSLNGDARPRYTLNRDLGKTRGRKLLSALALGETQLTINSWETMDSSPRRGRPTEYSVTVFDPDSAWSGAMPSTKTEIYHWSRVVPIADWHHHPVGGNRVLARSRMKAVLPEILDGRKISGSDAEAFYRNAFLKIFLETNPNLGSDVFVNDDELRDVFEAMFSGGQQWARLTGLQAKPIMPAVVDSSPHQTAKYQRIALKLGIPLRIFLGTEEGVKAGDQDQENFGPRRKERQDDYLTPSVLARFVDHQIWVGVVEPPAEVDGEPGVYQVEWPDPSDGSEEMKAKVFATRMQGMAAYVSGNVESVLPKDRMLQQEAGYTRDEVEEITDEVEAQLIEEEEAAQEVADEHGLEPVPPDGFQKPEPPPGMEMRDGDGLTRPGQFGKGEKV